MKKKIAILGSTGSIGKSLLNIIKEDINNFEIQLLTANKNYKELYKQTQKFNVKNIIITNQESFYKFKKLNKNKKINIFKDFTSLNKIFKKKVDYTMCAITGLEGLYPTIKIIRFTNKIAIANKEAIICGWNLLQKEFSKYNTHFIPVDSEHFSIWYGLNNETNNNIKELYLTASGGPFFNLPLNKFKKIKIQEALAHPNWKMGKKISIDSATMMNKIFEVIEAKNIFNIQYKNIYILSHPASYVHAIINFHSGLLKLIAHQTSMSIPIFNTLYSDDKKKMKSGKININYLNNLQLKSLDKNRYPVVKILKKLPNKSSLFETILVTANDELVKLFLKKNINFIDITKKLLNFINKKEFNKFKKISPRSVKQILKLNNYVRLKINPKSI